MVNCFVVPYSLTTFHNRKNAEVRHIPILIVKQTDYVENMDLC